MSFDSGPSIKQSGHYYGQLIDFQDNRPRPLAELDHYILQDDFFEGCYGYSGEFCPSILTAAYPKKALGNSKTPFNVAAFNLSMFYGPILSEETRFRFLKSQWKEPLEQFYNFSGKLLSIAGYDRKDEIREDGGCEEDMLLFCYPGRIDPSGWDDSYPQEDRIVKSKFFGFLWHKNFLTEKQLIDNGVMQDWNCRDIDAQKEFWDKKLKF